MNAYDFADDFMFLKFLVLGFRKLYMADCVPMDACSFLVLIVAEFCGNLVSSWSFNAVSPSPCLLLHTFSKTFVIMWFIVDSVPMTYVLMSQLCVVCLTVCYIQWKPKFNIFYDWKPYL